MGKQLILDVHEKLIVDLFAGGGGMSVAFERAFGRSPDIAINHNEEALSLHRANHPLTRHFIADVYEVCPHGATQDRPVGWLHGSPDCTDHSQASGGQPRRKKIRGLSWVLFRWAGQVSPDVISLENVRQILKWGPLIAKRDPITGRCLKRIIEVIGSKETIRWDVAAPGERVPVQQQYLIPDPKREGQTWRRFVAALEHLGYVVEYRILCAADLGGHTTRERLFMIARRDGLPISWPEVTHFKKPAGKQKKWNPAADCIDFSDLGKSIFTRPKPLAPATMRRIAKGIKRYVLDSPQPFIVNNMTNNVPRGVDDPMATCCNGGHKLLATPSIVPIAHYNGADTAHSAEEPLRTITAATKGGEFAVATPIIAKFRGDSIGHRVDDPLPTITSGAGSARPAGAAHALGMVSPILVPATHQGADRVHSVEDPMRTITAAHRGETMLASPVLIQAGHGEGKPGAQRWSHGCNDITGPLGTVTASGGGCAVAAATLVQTGYGEREGQAPRALDIEAPLGTVVGSGKHAVATAYMMQANDGFNTTFGRDMGEPLTTITNSGSQQQLVTAFMSSYYTDDSNRGRDASDPMATITTENRIGLVECQLSKEDEEGALRVAAFLMEYYSEGGQWSGLDKPLNTITTRDRIALVTVHIKGTPYVIVDIRLRMLKPRELFNGQDFPPDYIIDHGHDGRKFSISSQVRMCGNSVNPVMAEGFLIANAPWMSVRKVA